MTKDDEHNTEKMKTNMKDKCMKTKQKNDKKRTKKKRKNTNDYEYE